MHWDGHDRYGTGKTIYYSTVDSENADIIQAIAVLSGYRCHRGKQVDNRKKSYKDVHRLTLVKKYNVPTGKLEKTQIPYDGRVYCVKVPTGAFVIRRNNKVSITGNSLHVESMIKLFHTFIDEHKKLWKKDLKAEIYQAALDSVDLEDKFIDLAFELGDLEDLTKEDVKKYIRYIADRRLLQLGLKPKFKVKENPLPWLDWILNGVEHANFFEIQATEYGNNAVTDTWDKVWDKFDKGTY
jgi:ribonucleotide reductase beta subunit family protein with ferritin-like domain